MIFFSALSSHKIFSEEVIPQQFIKKYACEKQKQTYAISLRPPSKTADIRANGLETHPAQFLSRHFGRAKSGSGI